MPKSLFKLCYLIALYSGDNTFHTNTLSDTTQLLYIDQMVQDGMIGVNNSITDKGEILIAQLIGLYTNSL